MRHVLLITFYSIAVLSYGQTRTITGKVIDEFDLNPISEVRIQSKDTVLLGTTDENGNFKIDLSSETNELLLSWLGMQWTSIKLSPGCVNVEVIMLLDGTYHYKSHKKVDRIRKERFNNLTRLHVNAISKGAFINETQCFTREFQPYKPSLDEIRKELKGKRKQIKEMFERLEIGDTVRIPYSGSYRSDGTNRTTLSVWSYVTDKKDFDCIIEGIVLSKNKRNRGYNLEYKVTNCELCKYDSIVYQGRTVIAGEYFAHNMRYFKVLTK